MLRNSLFNPPSLNTDDNQTNVQNNTISVTDFCERLNGVWMLVEEDNFCSSVSFITITDDMQMTDGVYPGSYGRTCKITQIEQKDDGSFQTILHYPALEATETDYAMPELNVEATFVSSYGFSHWFDIVYEDGSKNEYVYIADEFEQAIDEFDEIIKEKDEDTEKENNATSDNKASTKSDIKADVWYTVSPVNVVKCQNAEVSDAVSASLGKAFLVNYYPVCKKCHICGTMRMRGVGVDSPLTETYYCQKCNTTTYVHFKVAY